MLTRKRPEFLPTTLRLQGQGETVVFNVTYHNRKQSEIEAKLAEVQGDSHQLMLYAVKDWDAEYPLSLDGIKEMEDDRPGMVLLLIQGFHEARRVQKEKN